MKNNLKQKKRVGAVIPVFNRRAELEVLLGSLLKQTFNNEGVRLDILIVDNGSTDSDIQNDFLDDTTISVLRLPENLGACHGFNRGMNHLLTCGGYDYLWLLDSDLWVAPDALERLVAVMEENPRIGLAGSLIVNAFDHRFIVEAGAMIELSSGSIHPLKCNEPFDTIAEILSVDYVGSGVSLIRAEAARQAGYYDERYHFLWEDMDYGLCMKKHGYRVVAVSGAVVYHPPFTEKRNPNIYAYYGVRNPLLTVAKYSAGLRMPYYLFVNLCRYLRIGLLMLFSGREKFARLTFRAISDYVAGRFGKADLMELEQTHPPTAGGELKGEKRVVILGLGGKDAVQSAVEFVRASCRGEIVLVVQGYRLELLGELAVDRIIAYDDRAPDLFREYWKTGMTIIRQGGCVVNTDLTVVSPLCYFGCRTFGWDHREGRLLRSRFGLLAAWRPAAAVILAPFLALFILPSVWLASLKHRAKQPVLP